MADPPELPGGWLPPRPPTAPPQRQSYQPPTAPRDDHDPLPVFVNERARQGTNGLAVTGIVCAVASLGLLVFSLGLSFVFSLPLGIAGWLCAARSDPELNPGQRKTGQVLSIIAVVLSVTAAVVWVILLAAGFSVEELQRNLEQELERQRRQS